MLLEGIIMCNIPVFVMMFILFGCANTQTPEFKSTATKVTGYKKEGGQIMLQGAKTTPPKEQEISGKKRTAMFSEITGISR
jgi:hypothetical protein